MSAPLRKTHCKTQLSIKIKEHICNSCIIFLLMLSILKKSPTKGDRPTPLDHKIMKNNSLEKGYEKTQKHGFQTKELHRCT